MVFAVWTLGVNIRETSSGPGALGVNVALGLREAPLLANLWARPLFLGGGPNFGKPDGLLAQGQRIPCNLGL